MFDLRDSDYKVILDFKKIALNYMKMKEAVFENKEWQTATQLKKQIGVPKFYFSKEIEMKEENGKRLYRVINKNTGK